MPLTGSYTGVGAAPSVASAEALSQTRVRVTFSESMLQNAAYTTAANYTLTPAGGSAARTVTSVSAVSSTVVDLTLDGVLTAGTDNYTVDVANTLQDLFGNTLSAPLSDTISGPSTLSVTATPNTVQNDGGYQVLIEGAFDDGTYVVYVGPNSDDTDPACYSNVAGSGNVATAEDGAITIAVPPLAAGGPYAFTFVKVTGSGPAMIHTSEALTVTPHLFRSRVLAFRRLFPPWWKTGYRYSDQRSYPQ